MFGCFSAECFSAEFLALGSEGGLDWGGIWGEGKEKEKKEVGLGWIWCDLVRRRGILVNGRAVDGVSSWESGVGS